MTSKKNSISIIARVVLGALLVGTPVTAAFAGEPEVSTAASAEARAQHYREQAAHYRALGGVSYKSGLVQRAEADAAKYTVVAERLRTPDVAAPARTPEAERYAQLAAHYRAMGGSAYKSGLVQWAESQQRKHEPSIVTEASATPPQCFASKPAVKLLACSR